MVSDQTADGVCFVQGLDQPFRATTVIAAANDTFYARVVAKTILLRRSSDNVVSARRIGNVLNHLGQALSFNTGSKVSGTAFASGSFWNQRRRIRCVASAPILV